jgi:hypothetical protein
VALFWTVVLGFTVSKKRTLVVAPGTEAALGQHCILPKLERKRIDVIV